jgi:hypothetical protein
MGPFRMAWRNMALHMLLFPSTEVSAKTEDNASVCGSEPRRVFRSTADSQNRTKSGMIANQDRGTLPLTERARNKLS